MKTTLKSFIETVKEQSDNKIFEVDFNGTKFFVLNKEGGMFIGFEIEWSKFNSDMEKMLEEFGENHEINVEERNCQ